MLKSLIFSNEKDVQQSLQPDSAIVTVCATRFARFRTNRANHALPVKRMLERRTFGALDIQGDYCESIRAIR